MRVLLTVIDGPHKGLHFAFDKHDTFLVGRSRSAHFQLPAKDKYFSRIHFMVEVNPPHCRLIDMGSHNGTYVNAQKVLSADVKDGDEIRAGHTVLRVTVEQASIATPSGAAVAFDAHTGSDLAIPAVPGFTLEHELGRGILGVTYLGTREGDPERLAIKVVKPEFQGSPAQVHEFLQSARLLMQLDHAHIVRLCAVEVCPEGFYFASAHLAGCDAAAILQREGPLSIMRTLRWVDPLLQALQYAHAKNVIHRDIKPTNVLVGQIDGTEVVKFADFGLARVYQSAPFSGLALTAEVLRCASFMPPEVLYNYGEVNHLGDQYSMAALVYYLLTGESVMDMPATTQKRYSSLLRRKLVPLRERRGDVPEILAEVVHKGLARTPEQRFASIAKFRTALIGSVQGE